jgi:hypothetical protein
MNASHCIHSRVCPTKTLKMQSSLSKADEASLKYLGKGEVGMPRARS